MRTRVLWLGLAPLLIAAVAASPGQAQSWSPARLLNNPAETEVKEPKLASSLYGGFHALYKRAVPGPWAWKGRVYAAWEFWGNNRPQAYYSVLPGVP